MRKLRLDDVAAPVAKTTARPFRWGSTVALTITVVALGGALSSKAVLASPPAWSSAGSLSSDGTKLKGYEKVKNNTDSNGDTDGSGDDAEVVAPIAEEEEVLVEETETLTPGVEEDGFADCTIRMQDGAKVPCYSNRSLTLATYDVTRAVIMVHGTDRNAEDYFNTAVSAAELAGKAGETLIVAPHFQSTADSAEADELQWSSWGWKIGNKSVDKAGLTRASSFAVVDRLIETLTDRSVFPSLDSIVVTGHSAGGQFTQRYAAGTGADLGKTTYRFRYVVANPGSYMYVNEYRPYAKVDGQFTVPQTSCLYDDYKYGLRDRNAYMRESTDGEIINKYSLRDVVYLLGTEDTVVSSNLDTGCEASLQGANRYERGRNYMQYMDYFYSGNNHVRVDVPGVGHSRGGMYKSSAGLGAVFD